MINLGSKFRTHATLKKACEARFSIVGTIRVFGRRDDERMPGRLIVSQHPINTARSWAPSLA